MKSRVVLAALALGVGCLPPGEDGDEQTGLDVPVEDPGHCEVERIPLDSIEELSEIGYSGLDAIEFAEGEHVIALRWTTSTENVEVDFGSELPATMMTMSVDFGANPKAIFNKSTLVDAASTPGQPVLREDLLCLSWVGVQATVSMQTEDGTLDESFSVEVRKEEDRPGSDAGTPAFIAEDVSLDGVVFQLILPSDGSIDGEVFLLNHFPITGIEGSLSLAGEVEATQETFSLTFGSWPS